MNKQHILISTEVKKEALRDLLEGYVTLAEAIPHEGLMGKTSSRKSNVEFMANSRPPTVTGNQVL